MLYPFILILLVGMGFSLPAQAHTTNTLTSIKPVQLIAAAVLDGVDNPEVLLPAGASPHTYALRPSDRRSLQQAKRIYWVGPELERFLERLLAEQQGATALMQQQGISLRTQMQSLNFQHAESGHDGHHHADDGHHHAPGSLDAHIWLTPDNALAIAQLIASDAASLYPDQQATLQANLARFEQRLGELDSRLKARLAPLKDKPYFVFHDGYGYFEDHYGLRPRGIFSLSPEVQPGARHINFLRQQLQVAGSSCVFSEPQFTPRLIKTLTEGLNTEAGVLDPLGTDIPVTATGYEEFLEGLGESLASCLERL